MFKELYKYLKEKGFETYSIGQHKGLCSTPYIVIKENGTSEVIGTTLVNESIELLVYYPVGSYSGLSDYTKGLLLVMKNFNKVRRVIDPVPTIIDDDKKAYMTSYYFRKIKTKEGA